MPSYLITGASRGLGLGFAAQLLKDKHNIVIATARSTTAASGLQELKAQDKNNQLKLVDLDVSKPDTIRAAAKKTAEILPDGLDHLVSNAGVSYNELKSFEDIDMAEFTAEVDFTIKAPVLLMREFLPLIRKSKAKRVMIVTSGLGSIQNAAFLPDLANGYSVARAALNMVARKWSPSLKTEGITIALIHPGWVGVTELGNGIKEWVDKYHPSLENLTVEKSAADCMKVLNALTIDDSGEFFNHDGTKLPF